MWELDYKGSWALKNWCFSTVVLEKTLESPLDCKDIQLVHPKGDQSWVFTGRTDVEAETPKLWPPDGKNRLIGKDPDAGKVWRRESESEVAQSCPTLCDPWTVAHQAPPSMGFSRQESWSGLPFPSPLKVGGEGENRGWDGWMASLTQWTWVWASSGRW